MESLNDPLVARAEKIFERVAAAADKKANRLPKLIVIKEKGDPWALSIPDGSIIVTYRAIKICYKDVNTKKGDSRLAFIMGHELAHLANDDFWHAAAFNAVLEHKGEEGAENKILTSMFTGTDANRNSPEAKEAAKLKESRADQYGLIYMTMAGYDPKVIVDQDETNFFEEWVSQITGKATYTDSTHPGPKERAEFVRAQIVPVVEALDFFHFGVRLYQLGWHDDSVPLLDLFKERFPGREVFNNIGLANYQLAMKVLKGCDPSSLFRFKLPTKIDEKTSAGEFKTKAPLAPSPSDCFQNDKYRKHTTAAIENLKKSTEMDPTYLPARINLSSALIMVRKYSNAKGVADEALEIQPDNPNALNNKAVALYLSGLADNIDTANKAIEILKEVSVKHPSFSDVFYNMAVILSDLGESVAATETGNTFLKIESKGLYADALRQKLGIKSEKKMSTEKAVTLQSPIKLGNIKKETQLLLNGMKKREFTTGRYSGEIYEGKAIKLLVVDNSMEIVETLVEKPTELSEFKRINGEPVKTVKGLSGMTLIYSNFAIDVVDGVVKKMVYFEREI